MKKYFWEEKRAFLPLENDVYILVILTSKSSLIWDDRN